MGETMFNLKGGILTIDGIEMEDCEIKCYGMDEEQEDETKEYVKNNIQICKNAEGQLVGRLKITRMGLLALMGLLDWAYRCCPSKRVRHLLKHGKNERVRYKNYKRAVKLIVKDCMLRGEKHYEKTND